MTDTVQRKVNGYIFLHNNGMYYLEPQKGYTYSREHAHVYTAKEAKATGTNMLGWGGSEKGKWIVVYE